MKTITKYVLTAAITLVATVAGPPAVRTVSKWFEAPPLSPLAKVVVEKLDTGSWSLLQDGIACDTLWIRGETEGRNSRPLNADDLKGCGVYIRNASASKEVMVNDQLQAHELKVILPKARAMYAKLVSKKNAATARVLTSQPKEEETPAPVARKKAPHFSTCGKMVYDALANSKKWKLKGRENQRLSNGPITLDLSGQTVSVKQKDSTVIDADLVLPLNGEECTLIFERAKNLREEIVQNVVKGATEPHEANKVVQRGDNPTP